jgi:hypothetical protein
MRAEIMENLIVIIDRVKGSDIQQARAAIEEVLTALEPLKARGLRLRVTTHPRSP